MLRGVSTVSTQVEPARYSRQAESAAGGWARHRRPPQDQYAVTPTQRLMLEYAQTGADERWRHLSERKLPS
ncbi:hypothetical protein NDU88_001133 [Pleurodeles waltl]|uniref:Uncharacterized protein n=1 Tax=Pleurodeles waltl TaxID=8319 RepID=A0AAV7WLF6_PLEWA|nr:hypothetical protein NDU88_001133 [Pleurodeles waltl]